MRPCVPSMNGSKYILSIINDFTHFTWMIPILNKALVQKHLTTFINNVENKFDSSIKLIMVLNS